MVYHYERYRHEGTLRRPTKMSPRVPKSQHKVDNPYSITFLIKKPIIEGHVVWRGFKNGYQKDTCLKKNGPLVQNMITILDSIFNIIGWVGGGDL